MLTFFKTNAAHAHCDAPCGVYDPASARISAEAVVSLTKKLLDLKMPDPNNEVAMMEYRNTMTRYVMIKEQQAQQTKDDLLILWTDYFKPQHLEQFPDLHETFWKAAKLCSECKVHVSLESAEKLLEAVKNIHEMFWKSKNKEVPWILAA